VASSASTSQVGASGRGYRRLRSGHAIAKTMAPMSTS
jgi:hypothetical protein